MSCLIKLHVIKKKEPASDLRDVYGLKHSDVLIKKIISTVIFDINNLVLSTELTV